MPDLNKKYVSLQNYLQKAAPLAIAFSGGVDSAFLLKAASETLASGQFLAVTVRADLFPAWEFEEAAQLALRLAAPWLSLSVDALAAPGVAENPPDRCYFCKKAIFQELLKAAAERGFPVLADGSNASDQADFRPGAKAVAELGVISPLKAVGLEKDEIRALSARLNLPTWNKPAYACLASRFPYGRRLTRPELGQVEEGENILRALGFGEIRLRHHGEIARLEIGGQDFSRFLDEKLMAEVNEKLKSLGFPFVALDLAPYRRGSLNENLDKGVLEKYGQ